VERHGLGNAINVSDSKRNAVLAKTVRLPVGCEAVGLDN